ncbi:beta-lactamase family protein [Archangium violaceum]|nr:beta-lactamase family protein [Archangium violaceum]
MGDRNTCRRLPGARFEYSNTNDILVSHIIEKVTGTPLAQRRPGSDLAHPPAWGCGSSRRARPRRRRRCAGMIGAAGRSRRRRTRAVRTSGGSECVGHGARTLSVPRLAETGARASAVLGPRAEPD